MACGITMNEKHRRILEQLAQGKTHSDILATDPRLTAYDIAGAAAVALTLVGNPANLELGSTESSGRAKKRLVDPNHPRAGLAWSKEEIELVRRAFLAGQPLESLVRQTQRRSGGILSRLASIGLIEPGEEYASAQSRQKAVAGPL